MSTLFAVEPTDTLHDRRIDNVIRYEIGDAPPLPMCQHVFNHPPLAGEFRWEFGDYDRFTPNLRSTQRWCYVVYFSDGTRGVCKVDEINRALAACNYRIGAFLSRART